MENMTFPRISLDFTVSELTFSEDIKSPQGKKMYTRQNSVKNIWGNLFYVSNSQS